MKNFSKELILFLLGGLVYVAIEILYRGWSHWSMFVLGGVCFLAIGAINYFFPWNTPLLLQMLIGACIITSLEFLTGCIINIKLGWNVWDYSRLPLNLYGQISLPSSLAWYFLAGVGIYLDDWLRWKLFKEEEPHYKIL